MADEVLIEIDEAFARARAAAHARPRRPGVPGVPEAPEAPEPDEALEGSVSADAEAAAPGRSGWIEGFLAIQLLWGVFLFLPGAQSVRGAVRALPYVSSLALLAWYFPKRATRSAAAAAPLLIGALLLLVANLLHPTSQLLAGVAQCVFQLSIAAPLFWVPKTIRNPQHLEKLLLIVLVMNFASAGLGLLQVYFPDRFMPPQLALSLAEDWLSQMTYVGSGGRIITRPPGLSDTPGGASVAAGLTAVLGLALCFRRKGTWQTLTTAAMSAIGLAVVYLTQTRSVLLMVVGASATLGALTLRQGRVRKAGVMLGLGGALLVATFLWASAVGGSSIDDRFLGLQSQGALNTFRTNRGNFLDHTMGELLDLYPFGAGIGRWGMMNAYFADQSATNSQPIYVEIQLTGWLLDGGVLMWALYGGAIVASILAAVRLVSSADPLLADLATVAVAVQVFIAGMAMAGPTFNTQLGILFWTISAAIHGAGVMRPGDVERPAS